jgi:peptide/nickel transport system substrate-binding protein
MAPGTRGAGTHRRRRAACLALVLAVLGLPDAGRAAAHGRLVVCDDVHDPLTLDPQKQFSEKNAALCQQMFEGLVQFDPDGRIVPALAVSWERLDPLRVRFHLRKGVVFHDGEAFDAGAVKYSIERYLDPATHFPARAFVDSIAGAEVIDADTVVLATKYPDSLLLNRLAAIVLIVPPQYLRRVGDEAFARSPVGTGPFRFVSWEEGRAVVMEAFDRYWMPAFPRTKTLVFRFVPEAQQVRELLAGRIDLLTELPGTATLAVTRNPRTRILKKESLFTVCASLNVSSGPLRDVRVRQAMNYAIDKTALIRYDLLGNGRPLASLSMEGETGHDPDLRPYAFDPAKARACRCTFRRRPARRAIGPRGSWPNSWKRWGSTCISTGPCPTPRSSPTWRRRNTIWVSRNCRTPSTISLLSRASCSIPSLPFPCSRIRTMTGSWKLFSRRWIRPNIRVWPRPWTAMSMIRH